MSWTTPHYDEVKMDAEIGSYNEDTDPPRDLAHVEDEESASPAVQGGGSR